jgi:hypothetical protein
VDALVFKTLQAVAQEQDAEKRQLLMARSNGALGRHFQRHTADMEEVAYDLLNRAWSDAQSEDILPRIIEIALDFWGTFGKLQGQANEKLRQLPTLRLVELIQAGITAGNTYGTFAAASLTAAQIDPIIEQVANRSKGNVTIIGTRQATRQLAGIGLTFGPNISEQVFRTGQIGVYKGYGVVEVENFEDFAGNLVLPTNELWVVGQNAGRLTYYGDNANVQQLSRPAFYVRWETEKYAGMLLYGIGRGRIGRIVLT